MWATGTSSMLRQSFPPARFRQNPFLPALEHFSLSFPDGYNACTYTLQQNTGSRIFPDDAGSDPLVDFGTLRPGGNYADDAQIPDYTHYSGPLGPSSKGDQQSTPGDQKPVLPDPRPQFKTLTKKVFQCTYNECGTRFTRISDLKRHHASVHLRQVSFFCRIDGCQRGILGFTRKDKRDDHERRVHEAEHLQGNDGA